jgi:hypothetical protein
MQNFGWLDLGNPPVRNGPPLFTDSVRVMTVSGKLRRPKRGQGVIEYSGALVIAAVIVAAGLIIVPPNFAGMVNMILSTMGEYLTSQLS